MTPFELASLGLSLYSGIQGAADERKQGRLMKSYAMEQMRWLDKEMEWYQGVQEKRKDFATDIFGNKLSTLAERTGLSMIESNRSFENQMAKSGLASSGTVQSNQALNQRAMQMDYENQKTGLADNFKQFIMEQGIDLEQRQNEVNKQKMQLRSDIEAANQMTKSRFLGIF